MLSNEWACLASRVARTRPGSPREGRHPGHCGQVLMINNLSCNTGTITIAVLGSSVIMPKVRDLFRALFYVIKSLCAKYGVDLPNANVSKATDDDLKSLYKKLVLKCHPDKGGNPEDFKKLREAYENWRAPPKKGRPHDTKWR